MGMKDLCPCLHLSSNSHQNQIQTPYHPEASVKMPILFSGHFGNTGTLTPHTGQSASCQRTFVLILISAWNVLLSISPPFNIQLPEGIIQNSVSWLFFLPLSYF